MDEELDGIIQELKAQGKDQTYIDEFLASYNEEEPSEEVAPEISPENEQLAQDLRDSGQDEDFIQDFLSEMQIEPEKEEKQSKYLSNKKPVDDKEKDIITGPVGDFLNGIPGYDEFEDIVLRGFMQGIPQRKAAAELGDILVAGMDDEENLQEASEAYYALKDNSLASDEQREFEKYIEEHGDDWGTAIKGFLEYPTASFTSITASMVSMFNSYSAGTAAATAGATVGVGAVAGSVGGPVGTAVGAALTTPVAIRNGFSAAGGMTDALVSSGEYIEEELRDRGLKSTPENFSAILKDPEALSRVRSRALARGASITAINMLTFKASTGAVSKASKRVAKLKPRAQTAINLAIRTGIEIPGEGVGELVAQIAADEEISPAGVILEATGGLLDTGVGAFSEQYNVPQYSTNGQKNMPEADFLNFVKNAPLSEVTEQTPTVKNNPEIKSEVDNIIYERTTKQNIQEAHPSFDEDKVNNVFNIQKKIDVLNQKPDNAQNKLEKKKQEENLKEALGYAEPKEGTTTTTPKETKTDTRTPAEKVSEAVAAEEEAKEVTPEEDIDADLDDPITAAFGPVEDAKTQLKGEPTLDEQIETLGSEVAQLGPEGQTTPEGKAKLAEFKKLNDKKHFQQQAYNKKHGTKLSVEEMNTPEVKAQVEVDKHVVELKKTFPGISIDYDTKTFNQAAAKIRKEGGFVDSTAKGFVHDGKIYLDPKKVTPDTAFHEVSHLWSTSLEKENPALFKRGIELLKGTESMRIVNSIPAYNKLKKTDLQAFYQEVMANHVGKASVQVFDDAQKQTKWEKWMNDFTKWLKKKLGIKSDKAYEDLTLEDWTGLATEAVVKGEKKTTKGKDFTTQNYAGTAFSVPEAATTDDIARARKKVEYREFKQKGTKAHKGWSKEDKYKALVEEQVVADLEKAGKKVDAIAKAKAEGKRSIVPTEPAMKNKSFAKVAGMIENYIKTQAKSYSQSEKKYIKDIPTEDSARAIAKAFQGLVDEETTPSQFAGIAGRTALKIKPEDLSHDEFKNRQFEIGAALLQIMWNEGVIDIKKNHILSKPKKTVNSIYINDINLVDEASEAIASSIKQDDFRSAYIESTPPVQDKHTGEDGLSLTTRRHGEAQMNAETHPEVFAIKRKADTTPYKVDQEYLGYLNEFNKEGLLIDESDVSNAKSKRSKKRAINSDVASLNVPGDKQFTLAHQFVHNGRFMPASTDLNYQSAKYALAAYSFADPGPMGKKGWNFLNALAADTYGYTGGEDFQHRADFALENQETWITWAKDPIKYKKEIMATDTPMLFLRHIIEIKNAVESGNPETFKSGIPAHMDSTTSGLQVMAGLTNDDNTAKITNLKEGEERHDSYSQVAIEYLNNLPQLPPDAKATYDNFQKREAEFVKQREKNLAIKDKEKRDAAWEKYYEDKAVWEKERQATKKIAAQYFWNQPHILKKIRKIFKAPVMTKYYSSKKGGISGTLWAQFKDNKDFKGLNRVFTSWLSSEVFEAADRVFEGPGQFMTMAQEIAYEINKQDAFVKYNSPATGFTVVNDPLVSKNQTVKLVYPPGKSKEGKALEFSIAYNTKEKSLKDQRKQIAPLFVHSFDAAIVHRVLQKGLEKGYPVQTIHDSFATTPEFADTLAQDILDSFNEVVTPDNFHSVLEQIFENAGFPDYKARAKEKFDSVFKDSWNRPKKLKNVFGFLAGASNPNLAASIVAQQQDVQKANEFEAQLLDETTEVKSEITKEQAKPCK